VTAVLVPQPTVEQWKQVRRWVTDDLQIWRSVLGSDS
jgi:hypothetical protein